MKEDIVVSSTACQLSAVDKRLRDVNAFWVKAYQGYFSPDEFIRNAQSAIQSLRSVTFVLQNNKSKIPDFENWYTKWQSNLKNDPLMRWLVEARNRIEKQGDLESNSYMNAEIVASYFDEGPVASLSTNLFDDLPKIFAKIPAYVLKEHVSKNGVLRIRRIWVENSLPDHEILDVIAIGYGRIAQLLYDAHLQIGIPLDAANECFDYGIYDRESLGWRLPHMVYYQRPLTLNIALADGATLHESCQHIDTSKIDVDTIVNHYGHNPGDIIKRKYKNYVTMARDFFSLARKVFLRDGFHQHMMFFCKKFAVIDMFVVEAEDRSQKYLLMRQIADRGHMIGADAVFYISEAWTAQYDPSKPFHNPADNPDREEILCLTLVRKKGNPLDFEAEIIRDGDKVMLKETKMYSDNTPIPFFFAPLYKVWNKEIPKSWESWQSNMP